MNPSGKLCVRYLHRLVSVSVLGITLSACGENTAPGNDRGAFSEHRGEPAPAVSPDVAVTSADPATSHPASMTEVETGTVLTGGTFCSFSYGKLGYPVVAVSAFADGQAVGQLDGQADGRPPLQGVLKLHGKLVRLDAPFPVAGPASSGATAPDTTAASDDTAPPASDSTPAVAPGTPGVVMTAGRISVAIVPASSSGFDTFATDAGVQQEAILRFTIEDAVTRHYHGYYSCPPVTT